MSDAERKSGSRPPLSLDGKTPQEVVNFILGVFTAQYQRKAENTEAQLQTLKRLDCQELEVFWAELQKSASSADALHIFTNWIEGKLDGDGLSSGKASDGN